MISNPESSDHKDKAGVTRRTVMKGAAWAAPVIAVAAVAPEASASLPPCIGNLDVAGGTYPVNVGLAGCQVSGTHWDFQFRFNVRQNTGCLCTHVQVTLRDSPNRSQLWLNQTTDQPQRYVRAVLPVTGPGIVGVFPSQGQQVRNVAGDGLVGTITAPGTEQDSLHTLINASGSGLPPSGGACNGTNTVMASYTVLCSTTGANGPFFAFPNGVGVGNIDFCVPMIAVQTVCRTSSTQNDLFRFRIVVSNACGKPGTDFRVRQIQRNSDTNFPNEGGQVWSGDQVVGAGVDITTTDFGPSGNQFWISYTTDNGLNVSRIRFQLPGTVANC